MDYSSSKMLLVTQTPVAISECTCCMKCQKSRSVYNTNTQGLTQTYLPKSYHEERNSIYEPTKTKIFRPSAFREYIVARDKPYEIRDKRLAAFSRQQQVRDVDDSLYAGSWHFTDDVRERYKTIDRERYLFYTDESSKVKETVETVRRSGISFYNSIDEKSGSEYNDFIAKGHSFQPATSSSSTTPPTLIANQIHRPLKDFKSNSFDSASSFSGSEMEEEIVAKNKLKKNVQRAKYERTIKLYKFLIDLLEENHLCVTWINRESGIFKITDSEKLAQLWGEVKLNSSMTYEKLARSFRHYYKKGILDSGETIISPVSKCGKRKLYYKFSATTLKRFLGIEEK